MSSFLAISGPAQARRLFLGRSALVLSGAAVALLAGRDVLAAKSGKSTAADVRILNTALGAELEAIAAYQVGAESGLLEKPVLALAVQFQGHHKEHADVLAATVRKLGGKAVAAKSKYQFPVESLKNQADVLRFAAGLEKGAVSAYRAPCCSPPSRREIPGRARRCIPAASPAIRSGITAPGCPGIAGSSAGLPAARRATRNTRRR